jgi:clathrin heavy chain
VDTANGFNVERRDMKAEAMLMHRERYVIAVRAAQGDAATVVQVLDLSAAQKLVSTTVNEKVVFWRWISATKLALVGTANVYHLDISQGQSAQPVKIFERLS